VFDSPLGWDQLLVLFSFLISLSLALCLAGWISQRRSNIKQRSLYRKLPVAIARLAKDSGELIDCTDAFAEMLGYRDCKDCRNRFDLDFHHSDRHENAALLTQLVQSEEWVERNFILLSRDNSRFWATCSFHLNADDDAITISVFNVHSRFEAVLESQQELQLQLQDTLLAAISWDTDLKVTEWNDAATRMFGYSREEALGKHASELILPVEWRDRLDRIYRSRLRRQRTFRHTNRNRTQSGGTVFCDWYQTTIKDMHGRIIGWASLGIEISEADARLRKMGFAKQQVEADLKQSEERLGFYLEAIGSANWDYRFETRDLALSEDWIERFGYEDVQNANKLDFWLPLVSAVDLERLVSAYRTFQQSKQDSFYEEFRIRDKDDRQRLIRAQGRLIERDSAGRPARMVGIVTDVTDLKHTQDEKTQLQHQLFQAQKMETIGQLTGGIAHDFNNMLSSIIGYTNLVLDRGRDQLDDTLKDYLSEVSRAGQQAQNLVGNMLSFGRVGATENAPASLSFLVKDTIKLLKPSLPSSIELEVDAPDKLSLVQTNPVKLTQLLMNLCINAKDAMNGIGRLGISIDQTEITGQNCSACRKAVIGSFVELRVTDSGTGISNQLLPHIFEPLFTTKEVGRGSGMGLSMVHKIMHEIGGHILVESTAGVGTRFRLFFPPSGQNQRTAEASREDSGSAQRMDVKGHIMVVDDDAAVALYISEVLKRAGHRVTVKFDSMDALEAFRADPNSYDVVVTDQTMPKLTGDLLLQAMLIVRSELPVIICTGFSEQLTDEKASNLGAHGYIRKPIDVTELTTLIDDALTHQPGSPGPVATTGVPRLAEAPSAAPATGRKNSRSADET
jgi:PAS domain S-box-containing protein|tara:strand:- start:3289 stop:5832 length:2544 start_codon:yes stop_codon:yes gene_type:complete